MTAGRAWRIAAMVCVVATVIMVSIDDPKAYHALGSAGVAALLSIAFDVARIAERKP